METKKYTYRLPNETIDQLAELIDNNIIENRTDGIIKAVNSLYDDSVLLKEESGFLFMLRKVFGSSAILTLWDILPTDRSVIYDVGIFKNTLVTKYDDLSVTVSRLIGKEMVHVKIVADPSGHADVMSCGMDDDFE
jgi:hypothetical protein